MNDLLKEAYDSELYKALKEEEHGDSELAWRHLERAHILSQSRPWLHIFVHIQMIFFATRNGDLKEIFGQIPRILLAGPASFFDFAPKGNTGGTNAGMFTPMEIPEDLKSKIER